MAVSLHLASPEDAEAVASIYAHYVAATSFTYEYEPPPAAEMARRIADKAGVFPWLIAREGDAVLGYAYAGRLGARQGYDWSCEVSVYNAQNATGRGLGRALYTALLALLAAQGYRVAVGILSIPNPGSERFHERMGFARQSMLQNVGYKFGKPQSVAHYVKALLPVTENPPPPLPLAQLDQDFVQDILKNAVQDIGAKLK